MTKQNKKNQQKRGESFQYNPEFTQAVLEMDSKYDDEFVVANSTSGYICRPSCGKYSTQKASTGHTPNVRDNKPRTTLTASRLYTEFSYFTSEKEALKFKYNPCGRCMGRVSPETQHTAVKILSLCYFRIKKSKYKWKDCLPETQKSHRCREFRRIEDKSYNQWFKKIESKDEQTIENHLQELRSKMPAKVLERLDKNVENGNFQLETLEKQDDASSDSFASLAACSKVGDDVDSPMLANETPDYADIPSRNALEELDSLESWNEFIGLPTLLAPVALSSETFESSELPLDLFDSTYQPSSSTNSNESAANTPSTAYQSLTLGLEETAQYDNRYGMEQDCEAYLMEQDCDNYQMEQYMCVGTANPLFLIDENTIQLSDSSSYISLVPGPKLQSALYLSTDKEHGERYMEMDQTCCTLC